MYTSGQVAAMVDTPPSTLRRYVKQFAKHLSKSATRPRGRRFSELDIAMLARARELLQQGREPEEVDTLLAVMGEDDPEAQPDSALLLVPAISEALAGALNVSRQLRSEVGTLAEQVEEIAEGQGATRAELAVLRGYLRQPWYRRLFGQPPE